MDRVYLEAGTFCWIGGGHKRVWKDLLFSKYQSIVINLFFIYLKSLLSFIIAAIHYQYEFI